MSDNSLIVPTLLTTGSLHFAEVKSDSTIQDVINSLVAFDEVCSDVLGELELENAGWALQKIRQEESGRFWEEGELKAMGDGIVPSSTPVAPLLLLNISSKSPSAPPMRHHFSTFPLASDLRTPAALRLVSLHPLLSLNITFLRIPQIHDGSEWRLFISRGTIVEAAIELLVIELGLSKSFGGENLEYVIEEVWTDGNAEKFLRLPNSILVSNVIGSPLTSNPFQSSSAWRSFRFCVPDEWFHRSKSHLPAFLLVPSQSTLRHLASEDEGTSPEDEGTAKQQKFPNERRDPDWLSSLSQSRLSRLFDGWLSTPASTSPTRTNLMSASDRVNVSEPKLIEHLTGDTYSLNDGDSTGESNGEEPFTAAFEQMLDELGLKGSKREAMYKMPPHRKRQLLQQNRDFQSNASASSSKASGNSLIPFSTAAALPLIPQLTGDGGFMKRLSLSGWGAANTATSDVSTNTTQSSDDFDMSSTSTQGKSSPEKVADFTAPLQPQVTGSLWSRLWITSGGDKRQNEETLMSGKWYVDGLRTINVADSKLVMHLISLRVHLSTAKLFWIKEFLIKEKGMDALNHLLASLVGKGGERKKLTDVEANVLLEVVKCLRVLLNTEPGFNQVLSSTIIVTHIAYSLHTPSMRLRTLASELLAAICVLSLTEGHKTVLAAMSDYRIAFDESFRFESLIDFLRVPDVAPDGTMERDNSFGSEEEGVWEARTASMALINALVNCPDSSEERILLRDELSRRGLNEVIVTLRYIKPPDSLLTQLDVYTEEKFEDEEDMQERARSLMKGPLGHERPRFESEVTLEDLTRLARQHGGLYPKMVEILKRFALILQKDAGM